MNANVDRSVILQPSTAPLPIQDQAALRQALLQADAATLLMVLIHYTRDEALLERYQGIFGSPWDPTRNRPPADLANDLRERLFRTLTQSPAPPETPLPGALMKEMMDVNVGESVGDEFIPILLEQMGFEKQAPRRERVGRALPPPDFKIIVIGAGLSGILAGIKLAEAGYAYEIVEKNAEIGGTWLENIYPGVGVDTPSHFYSYSFELNHDWTDYQPHGAEVQAYLLRVVAKYELRKHITFNTKVVSLVHDDASRRWMVTVEGPQGKRSLQANAVINCQGPLNRWSMPKLPGLDEFQGVKVHTAGWNSKIDVKGKRVALIGTGASAAQVGPAIAPESSHLTVFQRARHWAMPNPRAAVPEPVRWALRHIPHYAEWFRFRTYWFTSDGLYPDICIDPKWPYSDTAVSERNERIRQWCLANIHSKFAKRPDLIEKLTPNYPVFGKRIVMDVGWYDMFLRDNVTLENSPIERITSDAIVTKDGRRHPVDMIVCATGFEIAKMLGKLTVIGRGGRNLGAEWGDDDPRAYLGVTVPGFPNYFMTIGPASGPAHAAGVNLISETQINYIIECLDLIVAQHAAEIEPTQAAYEAFNAKLDADYKGMIWTHPKADSYHKNSRGRVILACPYRLNDYWRMTRKPNVTDYQVR